MKFVGGSSVQELDWHASNTGSVTERLLILYCKLHGGKERHTCGLEKRISGMRT
jgi:hypothetical protein